MNRTTNQVKPELRKRLIRSSLKKLSVRCDQRQKKHVKQRLLKLCRKCQRKDPMKLWTKSSMIQLSNFKPLVQLLKRSILTRTRFKTTAETKQTIQQTIVALDPSSGRYKTNTMQGRRMQTHYAIDPHRKNKVTWTRGARERCRVSWQAPSHQLETPLCEQLQLSLTNAPIKTSLRRCSSWRSTTGLSKT